MREILCMCSKYGKCCYTDIWSILSNSINPAFISHRQKILVSGWGNELARASLVGNKFLKLFQDFIDEYRICVFGCYYVSLLKWFISGLCQNSCWRSHTLGLWGIFTIAWTQPCPSSCSNLVSISNFCPGSLSCPVGVHCFQNSF